MHKRTMIAIATAVTLGVTGLATVANAAPFGFGKATASLSTANAGVQLVQYRFVPTGRTRVGYRCNEAEVIVYDRSGRMVGKKWVVTGCPRRGSSLSERRQLYRPGELLK